MARDAPDLTVFRARIAHLLDDPAVAGSSALEHFEDGLLVVQSGRVVACGPTERLLPTLPHAIPIEDHRGKLIVPGFIDTHVHFAQTDIIASHAGQLLEWLEQHALPAEARFDDPELARDTAEFFCDELLRNGTTTAMVFATVHTESVDALFNAALARNMRLIAGKVLMDRNCPEPLREAAPTGDARSRQLIERWHGRGRLSYAVTPRFAPTSTEQQLRLAGSLFREIPDLHLQSHVAENRAEVAWVNALFPDARSYLDVYDRYGLLGPRALFAHCIWLDDTDRRRMADTGTAMAFCPTSNLFLGSGLFDLERAHAAGARVALGTDVGAGTSLSMLQTLNEAFKVLKLQGQDLPPDHALYLATLGAARSLGLDGRIGSFASGCEADFVLLDPGAAPLLARRTRSAATLDEHLFALMMLGDERCVAATYLLGRCVFSRTTPAPTRPLR